MDQSNDKPWLQIDALLDQHVPARDLQAYLDALEPAALLHAVFALAPEKQRALLAALTPEQAASLGEELPDSHVAELIEDMPAQDAAPNRV